MVKLDRHMLIAIGGGVCLSIFLFAVPGNGAMDPISIGLAVLLGTVFALSFWWAGTRLNRS